MLGEQRLVGRDDVLLAALERRLDRRLGRAVLAADQLDEDGDRGIGREFHRIVEPADAGDAHAARLVALARRHARDLDRPPHRLGEPGGVRLDEVEQAGADRAEAGDAEGEWRVHAAGPITGWPFAGIGMTLCMLSGD